MAIMGYAATYAFLVVFYVASYIDPVFKMHMQGRFILPVGIFIVMCLSLHLYHYLGGDA